MLVLLPAFVVPLLLISASAASAQVDDTQSPPGAASTLLSPRVDVGVSVTNLALYKLPKDNLVGGLPLGTSVQFGYFWTRHLLSQVEIASQMEKWDPDGDLEYVYSMTSAGRYVLTQNQLVHDYRSRRRTLAQLVQLGHEGLQLYVGGGVGLELQTMTTFRRSYTEALPWDESPPSHAKPVSDFAAPFPDPVATRRTFTFAQAGMKGFMGRRAYLSLDWKVRRHGQTLVRFGIGVELF